MIPQIDTDITELEITTMPSKTYSLNLEEGTIGELIDGAAAIKQAIQKILYTERYAYVIYSSQYGVELERLIGKDFDFVISDIERTIEEAILSDDRMLSVSDFTAEPHDKNSLTVSFVVNSTLGAVEMNTEVILV